VPDFEKCVAVRKTGKLLPARDAFYAFVEQFPDSTKIVEAKDMLGEINTQIYLTAYPSPDKEVYLVKKGDVIDRVAKHMKTSGELIMRANNLKANSNKGIILQIGQKLSIPNLELSMVINHKNDRVTLLNKGRFFKWYPILAWPPQLAKKPPTGGKAPPPFVKQAGKVTDRMSWVNGGRVTYADQTYGQATHWIKTSIGHCTLHSVMDEKAENRPPGGGIVLPPKALEELAALLDKGDNVTLE
jgi:LysM repeat protein